MLANAGKHHQHWPMSPNCQKNPPLGPTPETKKFESSKKFQKKFKCQVGLFFFQISGCFGPSEIQT